MKEHKYMIFTSLGSTVFLLELMLRGHVVKYSYYLVWFVTVFSEREDLTLNGLMTHMPSAFSQAP